MHTHARALPLRSTKSATERFRPRHDDETTRTPYWALAGTLRRRVTSASAGMDANSPLSVAASLTLGVDCDSVEAGLFSNVAGEVNG